MDSRAILEGLKAGTLVRAHVEDPTLRLVVELADWLAFPTELGKYPDDLDVLDVRSLYWPAAGKTLPLAVLRYRVRDVSGLAPDDVGVGLVGSVTFSLFSYQNHERPVEDVYAIHCYWECSAAELLLESDDVSPERLNVAILSAGLSLDSVSRTVRITFRKSITKEGRKPLDYPGEEVVVVAGEHQGRPGWLACDGPRSCWYPASEMPDHCPPSAVAMVHVGRVLLGFETHGVRRTKSTTPAFSLDDRALLATYEKALAAARSGSAEERKEAFDSFGPLANQSHRYVGLLTAAGRTADAMAFIQELAPYWDHNSGYAELGKLAFEANLFNVSKQFIERLRQSYKDHHRSETMSLLAQIYAHEGRPEDARILLRDCLARIAGDDKCSPREIARFSEPLLKTLRDLDE